MPRQPRVFVEGGIYPVYNRAAHGASVFAGDSAGSKFVEILGETLHADGHVVLAWACMGNHYCVVLGTSPVTLARSFGRAQSAFSRWRNHTLRSRGPTWQSRNQAKLVEDERYLFKVIANVHFNPIAAGLVEDPSAFVRSGHRQVVALDPARILARDEVRRLYGSTEKAATNAHLRALGAVKDTENWVGSSAGQLPWWTHEPDRILPVVVQPVPEFRPS